MQIKTSILSFGFRKGKAKADEMEKTESELPPFDSIAIEGGADIRIHLNSKSHRMSLETEKDKLQHIKRKVNKQGVLELKMNAPRGVSFKRPFSVDIYMSCINAIRSRGHLNLTCEEEIQSPNLEIHSEGHITGHLNVKTERLKAKVEGAGELQIRGTTQEQDIELNGAASYQGRELISKSAKAILNGPCKAILHATESAHLEANGFAKIKLTGSPKSLEKKSQLSKIEIQ